MVSRNVEVVIARQRIARAAIVAAIPAVTVKAVVVQFAGLCVLSSELQGVQPVLVVAVAAAANRASQLRS